MVGKTNAAGKAVRCTGISITTPPTVTQYSVNDTLDLTGMVVTASFSDGTTTNVTSQCTFSPANGTVLDSDTIDAVTVTYKGFTATQAITVSSVHIYGVYWDGSSNPAWTRTDDAANFTDPVPYVPGASSYSSPFDNLQPWAGMTRVTDPEAGELVKIPKFWYKWTRSGSTMKLQIADKAVNGFYVSPAHQDRGDGKGERDLVYVARYHCCDGFSSGISYKSTSSGDYPVVDQTRSAFRTNIHNIGPTIWQWDYAMYWTISMLYLVEFAHWNSQAKIGYGGCDSSSIKVNGLTDSMPYHTGTTAVNRNTRGNIQYRYIEDLWGNVFDWVDGIYFSDSTKVYIIKNPANFSDSSNGTKVGKRAASSGYISKWNTPSNSDYDWAIYPSAVSGSSSTYICDYCYISSGGTVLYAGGNYNQDQLRGLFYLSGNASASRSNGFIGTRLMKLP